MLNINKTTIAGHVGSVEIKYTSSDEAVLNLSIATNKNWKDKNGNKNTATQWHRVVVFGKLAALVKDWIKKGTAVYLEGELRTRLWQDKQGTDRWTTEVVLSGYNAILQVLDKKHASHDEKSDKDDKDKTLTEVEVPKHQMSNEADDPSLVVPDDDIPF